MMCGRNVSWWCKLQSISLAVYYLRCVAGGTGAAGGPDACSKPQVCHGISCHGNRAAASAGEQEHVCAAADRPCRRP